MPFDGSKAKETLAFCLRGVTFAAVPCLTVLAGPACIVLLSLLLQGCTRPSVHEPVTLTLLEEWSNKTFGEARQQELPIHPGNRNPSQAPSVSGFRAAKASFVARVTRDRRLRS